MRLHPLSLLLTIAAAPVALLLSGCALSNTASSLPGQGAALRGNVHGGQQPVVGAQVYLLAANTTGYGAASVSLLNSTGLNTRLDSSGTATNGFYYVLTDNYGSFNITGDYTCTPGSQVYLYALGGNPGSGVNSASGMMSALGNCPATGTLLATVPTIWVNEVSTVAAAYSFAGFATDALHVSSSGSASARLGIQNAFANSTNLVNVSNGNALTVTPAGNGNVQQANINALANVLVSCVNSTGPTSAGCNTLFNNALANGTSGTRATDTATATINIAHNPGINVAQLYTLATPKVAFAPTLSSSPQDWHLSITYSGGGMSTVTDVAIDSLGNAWTSNYSNASVSEFSPLGVPLSGTTGFVGGGLAEPEHLVIDTSNNVWVSNNDPNTLNYYAVSKFSNTGAALSNSGFPCSAYLARISAVNNYTCGGLTIDSSGNIWSSATSYFGGAEFEFSPTGASTSYPFTTGGTSAQTIAGDAQGHLWVPYQFLQGSSVMTALDEWNTSGVNQPGSPFTASGGLSYPFAAAVDGTGDIWMANTNNDGVTAYTSAGVPVTGSPFLISYTGNAPDAIAVDGANTIWVANSSGFSVARLTAAGALYPGMPFSNGLPVNSAEFNRNSLAVDGSGNLWVVAGNNIAQVIGAAAPTVVPVALGVKNNTIGTLP